MTTKNSRLYDTVTALAAAVEAYRACGNRVAGGKNGVMVDSYLLGIETQDKLEISNESIEKAKEIRNYLPKKLVFLALIGQQKSSYEFINEMTEYVQHDQIARSRLGLIIWAPKVYEDFLKDDAYRENLAHCTGSKFVGEMGKKITTKITIIRKRLINNYDSWIVTGHDEQYNLIEFWTKSPDFPDVAVVSGRVKKQQSSVFHNGIRVTTLNYVKLQGAK